MAEGEGQVRTVVAADGVGLRCEVVGVGDGRAGDGPPAGPAVPPAGPPVVLLHGSVATRSSFRKLRPFLAGHQLVLTELRGHGSAGPAAADLLPPGYGMATTEVDDLVAILDGLGLARVSVVGHSTGGTIAVAFARRHPERVTRMVLIEPTLLALLDPPAHARARADLQPVIDHGRGGRPLEGLHHLLTLMGAGGWAALPEASRQRTIDALTPLAHLTAPHVAALVDFVVSDDDIVGLAPPTQLVYGDASVWFEAPIAARLAQLRPDVAQLHVEGAGHNVHAERPDQVGPVVAGFLGGAAP